MTGDCMGCLWSRVVAEGSLSLPDRSGGLIPMQESGRT